jgi:uncharacterized Zn-finger protein
MAMSDSPEVVPVQQELSSNKKPKRFQCHRCQRMFARLEHLQRHERTHTQEKPFSCNKCDQRFSRRYFALLYKFSIGFGHFSVILLDNVVRSG